MFTPVAAAAQNENQRQDHDHKQNNGQYPLPHEKPALLLLPPQSARLQQFLVLPAFHIVHAFASF